MLLEGILRPSDPHQPDPPGPRIGTYRASPTDSSSGNWDKGRLVSLGGRQSHAMLTSNFKLIYDLLRASNMFIVAACYLPGSKHVRRGVNGISLAGRNVRAATTRPVVTYDYGVSGLTLTFAPKVGARRPPIGNGTVPENRLSSPGCNT